MSLPLPVRLEGGAFAVATRGLVKRFRRETALDGVDVQVPDGAVYVLVGPNGAGKSTLIRILLDLLRPDAGEAAVFGLDPRRDGPRVRAQVGYVPEGTEWGHGWMRAGRLLEHHATFYPAWDAEYAAELARALELPLDGRMDRLSKGQARRVHLVMALAHRPPLLLLDEPTDGLDPAVRHTVHGLLAAHLAETPTTVLLSTHRVHEVEGLADHLGVIRDGRLVAQVTRDALHRRLRRYRAEVPEGWSGVEGLNGSVVRREGGAREIRWSVWGDEDEVAGRLAASGATVRDASPLTLEDAALTLLTHDGDAR